MCTVYDEYVRYKYRVYALMSIGIWEAMVPLLDGKSGRVVHVRRKAGPV